MKKLKVVAKKIRATHIDELRKEREKEFAFVDDENTSPLDKLRALRDLQAELYKKEGYTGVLPELYITDEPNSFAVDGKNGETRKIFISLNNLKRGNSSALLYAHENAHLIQTDKDEEIAKYAETKIGEKKNKFTESEKEEYISKLKETVKIDKTLEEQFAEAKLVDEKDKEYFFDLVFNFITSSNYASDDCVLLDSINEEKLKKYGNNIYYDGYRIVEISKDGWAQLDFDDTIPNENDIALVTGITRLITHPINTAKNIKKEVKLLTENGREIIEEVGENDLKKLVDDTPAIKLIENTDKEIVKKLIIPLLMEVK